MGRPRRTEEYGTDGGHHYPAISLSGNARAIIGNVYGGNTGFLLSALDIDCGTTSSGGHLLELGYFAAKVLGHYGAVRTAVEAYINFNTKVGRCAKQLEVRQEIFHHALRNLLSSYAGLEVADEMLLNPDHSSWSDTVFADYLHSRFQGSIHALNAALDLIRLDLNAIAQIGQKCGMLEREFPKDRTALQIKQDRVSIKDKINYFLRQEDLGDLLKSLKDNTDEFRILLKQCGPRQERTNVSMSSQRSRIKVRRCQKVQEAAESLYYAFGLACTKHSKHRACLRLRADSGDSSQIQFTLLEETGNIIRAPLTGDGHTLSLQLTIESQVNGTIGTGSGGAQNTELVSTIQCCSKRAFEPAESDNPAEGSRPVKQKKTVAFAAPTQLITLPTLRKRSRELELPNFCSDSNFCTHLKRLLDQGLTDHRPLGYLHDGGCSKHLIYLKSRTQTISLQPKQHPHRDSDTQFSTLKHLCRKAENGSQISKVELCSLAKQLSIAVLQYHATPWLEQWDSEHVLLSSNRASSLLMSSATDSGASKGMLCSDYFLDVSIHNPQAGSRTPVSDRSRTLIRNWTLFSLGTMLLELAYSRPLRSMQKLQDIDQHNEHNTDYYTADRLQQSVASVMGTEYAELVRKCIQCDFGHGADLTVTKLQEGFYEDVVDRLEGIETKFRDMGL